MKNDQFSKCDAIASSIKFKKRPDLDSSTFPVSKLRLSQYDIRKDRDVDTLAKNIKINGQLEKMQVNKIGNRYEIINGRTRYLVFQKIDIKVCSVEVYEGLTPLESNYLNAQINSTHANLTGLEKLEFVKKHGNQIKPEELARALGLSENQTRIYLITAEAANKMPDVVPSYAQSQTGPGRSDVHLEAFSEIYKKLRDVDLPINELKKVFRIVGDWNRDSKINDRDKKKHFVAITSKLKLYLNNKEYLNKYSVEKLARLAIKQEITNNTSGLLLPYGSIGKYPILDTVLQETEFDFSVILMSEGLYRGKRGPGGGRVASETKRIIDYVPEVYIFGNEFEKLEEVQDYANNKGVKSQYFLGDVLEEFDIWRGQNSDPRKGLILINGAMFWSQRPGYISYLRNMFPNSLILFIFIDFYNGKSKALIKDKRKEIQTIYAGATTFDGMRKLFDNCEFERYASCKYVGINKPLYWDTLKNLTTSAKFIT